MTITAFNSPVQLGMFKRLFPNAPLASWNDLEQRLGSNGGWIVRMPGAAAVTTIEGRGLYVQFGAGMEKYSPQFVQTLQQLARSQKLNSVVWTTAIGDIAHARQAAATGAAAVGHNATDIFWKLGV